MLKQKERKLFHYNFSILNIGRIGRRESRKGKKEEGDGNRKGGRIKRDLFDI